MSYYFSYCYFYIDNYSFTIHNFYFSNTTTFLQLFEYISSFYQSLNICPCFDFQISNGGNYFNANENETLYNFYNQYGSTYLYVNIQKNGKECKCKEKFKDYYSKTKKEMINKFLEQIEQKNKVIKENEFKNNDLVKDKFVLQKEIDLKNKEIENLKKKNTKLKKSSDEQNEIINKLKEKNNNLNINLNQLKIDNQNHLNEINSLKKDKISLTDNINSLENNRKSLEQEITKLKKEEKILKLAVDKDLDTLKAIQRLGVGRELKSKYNTITINQETNSIIENKNYQLTNELKNFNKNFEDFYDIIIDIKSIKDINKGWEIKSNERGKKQYSENKNEPILKIGVIGNADKGKSFLLSKISKIDLPSGTSISTEGLSIKYPELKEYENRKIALLDSAGLETPVIYDRENKNSDLKGRDLFKEKSREKLITELFLQNYIIHNSDILILVVGKFTYSEQKLLNKIKTEIQRAKINKPLFIIHNLFTFFSKKQVEDHINDYLLKSVTFELEKGHKISTGKLTKDGLYYYEKNNSPTIYHLIYGNEGSEAGEFYNKFTLDFIENSFQQVTNLTPFDVIESVKERFIEISKDIIEISEKSYDKESFDESDSEKTIKLKDTQEIILKKCLIDELGFSNLKVNGFEPTYNYYKTDKSIIINVECPGKFKIQPKTEFVGEYTNIKLSGDKIKEDLQEKNGTVLFNSREFGKFSLDIPLKSEDYLITQENPKVSAKNGILTVSYNLKTPEETEVFEFGD